MKPLIKITVERGSLIGSEYAQFRAEANSFDDAIAEIGRLQRKWERMNREENQVINEQ